MDAVWRTLSANSKSVYQIKDDKVETWEKIFEDEEVKVQLFRDGEESYQSVCFIDADIFSLFRETTEEQALKDLDFLLSKLRPFLKQDQEHLDEDVLDKICGCIWQNPSWSAAHVAVDCSLNKALVSQGISELIDSKESENGMTPLHIAVTKGRLDSVRQLAELGASVSIKDNTGYTALHHGVSSFSDTDDSELVALLAGMLDEEDKLTSDIEEALTPLIMALKTKKFDAARIMVENNILLDVPDETGRPIHYALKHDKYLIATEILAKNDRQGFSRCTKYNATSLHWARSSEMIKMIFNFDYELNARSCTGHTAVHIMVKKGRNECLVELLAAGADPEIPDNEGNSPLHTASQLNNVDAIRALIVFNADVNARNHKGLTPRHYVATNDNAGEALQSLHMVGAKRCEKQTLTCLQGCLPWGKYDGDKMEYPHDPREECETVFEDYANEVVENMLVVCRDFHRNFLDRDPNERLERLLCLDGGGSRGIVEIQLLAAIERAADKRILDCFDWIAGTSAGAINTGILSTGACSTEMRKVFFGCTRELFAGTKPYSGEKLENILKEIYGEKKMMEIKKPRIMITGTLSNRVPPALHFFRNYKPPAMSSSRIVSFNGRYDKPPVPPDEETLWRAVRASTAAPTYFPPKDLFMDGGLLANNPTTDAMTEISEFYAEKKLAGEPVRKLGLVLSLGTGNGPVPAMKDIEVYVPQAVTDIFHMGANIKAAAHLGEIMLSLVTDARFRPADRARAWCNDIGAAYFRLSPNLSMMTDLDETDTSIVLKLMWETQVYINNNSHKIEQIGSLLSVM